MNGEQAALASCCGLVQEQNADKGRFLVDPQNFRARGGLRDHLVLV